MHKTQAGEVLRSAAVNDTAVATVESDRMEVCADEPAGVQGQHL